MIDMEFDAFGRLWLGKDELALFMDKAEVAALLDFILEHGVIPDDCVVIRKTDYQRLKTMAADISHALENI